jgi:hypothetical protein
VQKGGWHLSAKGASHLLRFMSAGLKARRAEQPCIQYTAELTTSQ